MTSGVFREVEIEWEGKTFSFTPSNRLLRRIEGEGISFPRVIEGVSTGAPAVGQVCFIVSEFLREAGADVDEDSVYDAAMTALASGDDKAFLSLCEMVVEAIAPRGLEIKKPQGRKSRPEKKKSQKG